MKQKIGGAGTRLPRRNFDSNRAPLFIAVRVRRHSLSGTQTLSGAHRRRQSGKGLLRWVETFALDDRRIERRVADGALQGLIVLRRGRSNFGGASAHWSSCHLDFGEGCHMRLLQRKKWPARPWLCCSRDIPHAPGLLVHTSPDRRGLAPRGRNLSIVEVIFGARGDCHERRSRGSFRDFSLDCSL